MSKMLTSSEVKKHNHRRSIWIVLKNDVYDVTAFLNEHPGGEDPLLDAAGLDATAAFEDVGHSEDARSLLRKYKIGSLAKGESCCRLLPRKWMSSCGSATSRRCLNDEKPWRIFDFDEPKVRSTPKHSKTSLRKCGSNSSKKHGKSTPSRKSSKSSLKRSGTGSPVLSKASTMSTTSPRIIPRVPSIVVPRRRGGEVVRKPSRAAPRPPSSSKWKWALLALAAAIIAGVAYKKYAS